MCSWNWWLHHWWKYFYQLNLMGPSNTGLFPLLLSFIHLYIFNSIYLVSLFFWFSLFHVVAVKCFQAFLTAVLCIVQRALWMKAAWLEKKMKSCSKRGLKLTGQLEFFSKMCLGGSFWLVREASHIRVRIRCLAFHIWCLFRICLRSEGNRKVK